MFGSDWDGKSDQEQQKEDFSWDCDRATTQKLVVMMKRSVWRQYSQFAALLGSVWANGNISLA